MKASKYNGLGNDFVIIEANSKTEYKDLAIKLCNDPEFNTDGFIGVAQNPLEMIFYNRDGSRASMCGNGIRCYGKYLLDKGIVNTDEFTVKTLAGPMKIKVTSRNPFSCIVNMGKPIYDKKLLGIEDDLPLLEREFNLENGEKITISSVFMGTVHTVVFVDNAEEQLNKNIGEEICKSKVFQNQTNVNFVEILEDKSLKVRTFERGVGWTKACGTGCCASYVIARDLKKINEEETKVYLEKGILKISGKDEIFMEGPAEFEKEIEVC